MNYLQPYIKWPLVLSYKEIDSVVYMRVRLQVQQLITVGIFGLLGAVAYFENRLSLVRVILIFAFILLLVLLSLTQQIVIDKKAKKIRNEAYFFFKSTYPMNSSLLKVKSIEGNHPHIEIAYNNELPIRISYKTKHYKELQEYFRSCGLLRDETFEEWKGSLE